MKRGTLCTLFFLFVINTDREADRKIKREKKETESFVCVINTYRGTGEMENVPRIG